MKVIIPPLHERISSIEDPFSHDTFGRKEFVENLTRLFRNSREGLVITIDAEWGGGKTTLVKLWESKLKNDPQFIPIYYDAFKNDFTGDVFLSIAVKIYEAFVSEVGVDDSKEQAQLENLKKESKELLKAFLKMGTTSAVGALAGGIVDSKGLIDASKMAWEKLSLGSLDVNVNQQFEAHTKSAELVERYQDQLKEMVALKSENRKIVFFIDELDRCRPDFAIHVIEKVKHLFNVDNVHFILAVNRDQLLQTISSAYGVSGGEASSYLQKFVHIETKLPSMSDISEEREKHYLDRFFDRLWDDFGFPEELRSEQLDQAISSLFSKKHLPLNPRDIERVMGLVAIYLMTSDIKAEKNLIMAIYAAALKVSGVPLYQTCREGRLVRQVSGGADKRCYEWAINQFCSYNIIEKQLTKPMSIDVEGLREVCAVIDIYEFPPEPVPQTKSKPSNEEKSSIEPSFTVSHGSVWSDQRAVKAAKKHPVKLT